MSVDLPRHPDYRACLYRWSIAQPELDTLDGRIYTESIPSQKTFPLGKITQLTTPGIVEGTHAAVRGRFQFDVWGGSPNATWEIADTWLSLLIHRLPGRRHSTVAGDFVAGLVSSPTGIARTTDTPKTQAPEGDGESSEARPRCRFTVQIVLRPAPVLAGS